MLSAGSIDTSVLLSPETRKGSAVSPRRSRHCGSNDTILLVDDRPVFSVFDVHCAHREERSFVLSGYLDGQARAQRSPNDAIWGVPPSLPR